MPAIDTIKRGDRITPADPPKCCRRPMRLTEGVAGPLWECLDCEDGIYVTADGRVLAVMRSA